MTMQQATQSMARVQTAQGKTAPLSEVRSIQLKDGWHPAEEVRLSYQSKYGNAETARFSEIQGFSDKDEQNPTS